ncbi:MAG: hypothetical protein J5614_07270, partial [Paludibacteraceae bacterium]|nr:hypothetical protein [Paludibacteraceae bacterium]
MNGALEKILFLKNPAKSLSFKDDRDPIDLKYAFTVDDLKVIFFNDNYDPSKFTKPAYYWVPLIALYSGMRREEICQL